MSPETITIALLAPIAAVVAIGFTIAAIRAKLRRASSRWDDSPAESSCSSGGHSSSSGDSSSCGGCD